MKREAKQMFNLSIVFHPKNQAGDDDGGALQVGET
jgi:hypothetical protein